MTARELRTLRRNLDLTQAEMALGMGLGLRAYQDIEGGDADIRDRHGLLAERLALTKAVENRDPMLAPANVRREALTLARLINGE